MTPAIRHGLMIGAAAAALSLLLGAVGVLDGLERTTWDWRVRALAEPSESTDDIVLILLDQDSLDWGEEENGLSWPWPRQIYAPLIDFCSRAGAKVIAFDVLFTEFSQFGVEDDEIMAGSIAASGRFIGARFLHTPSGKFISESATEPIQEVIDSSRLLANVSDEPDPDGVFRDGCLIREFEGVLVPSLGTAAWLLTHAPDDTLRFEDNHLIVGDHRIPLADNGTALLPYRGPASVMRTFKAAAVIKSEIQIMSGEEPLIDPAEFDGAYVFFGFSAPGLLDLRPTPIGPVNPGVVVHATVLDALLSNDLMQHTPQPVASLALVVLAMIAALTVVRISNARAGVMAGIGLLLVAPLLGYAAYPIGWWWPIIPIETAMAAAVFGALARNYAVEGRQRRFIKSAFKHYLSPAVIDRILVDPDALKLGGERRELTIMFSDLAGFTSLSEGMEPEDLTQLLNDYLTDMTDIILEEGGTLDKYEGDAILAFWNAPLEQTDHAERACRAAIRCQRALTARRDEFRERSGHDMHMRMGLHSGEVIVGNMGSQQRFDYTVLGDAANLASRLEGANKAFDSWTMISAATLALAGGTVQVRDLGRVTVVGRKKPVAVHELTGLAGDPVDPMHTRFSDGINKLRDGDLGGALTIFAAETDDPVAVIFATRCREAMAADEPFTGDWNLMNK